MSSTILYKVNPNGDLEEYKGYRNSWRGAIMVWDTMSRAYLQKKVSEYIIAGAGAMQPVWDLWEAPHIPMCDRITLASTFDRVIVRSENFDRLTGAWAEYSMGREAGHLHAQAEDISKLQDCLGIAWNQTTVNHSFWQVEEGEDVWRPYNIFKDNNHWFLFNEVEEAK